MTHFHRSHTHTHIRHLRLTPGSRALQTSFQAFSSYISALLSGLHSLRRRKMNTPAFTTNPRRLARLEFNYNAGANREKIPAQEREEMDRQLLNVSPEYLQQLFANVAAIRKARKNAAAGAEAAAGDSEVPAA